MTRNWRGATYEIEITKPEGLCKGRASVTLDGRTLGDNLVPSHADGKVHEVKVTVQP